MHKGVKVSLARKKDWIALTEGDPEDACLKILERRHVPKEVAIHAGALAREVMARMIDPVWGCRHNPYTLPFVPTW